MSHNPFDLAHSSSNAFMSRDLKETLKCLDYLTSIKGIGVITASPGMGKSYALKCFVEKLNTNINTIVYINMETLTVSDFYYQLCDHLGLVGTTKRSKMFKDLQERIQYLCKEARKPLTLILDEAQELSHSIIKELQFLRNFEYDTFSCYSLILSGEPSLLNVLRRSVLESFRQRISVHYSFSGLSEQEVHEYLSQKFTEASASISLMDEQAISAVIQNTKGIPRKIDSLMVDALAIGSALNKNVIDSEVIFQASNASILTN